MVRDGWVPLAWVLCHPFTRKTRKPQAQLEEEKAAASVGPAEGVVAFKGIPDWSVHSRLECIPVCLFFDLFIHVWSASSFLVFRLGSIGNEKWNEFKNIHLSMGSFMGITTCSFLHPEGHPLLSTSTLKREPRSYQFCSMVDTAWFPVGFATRKKEGLGRGFALTETWHVVLSEAPPHFKTKPHAFQLHVTPLIRGLAAQSSPKNPVWVPFFPAGLGGHLRRTWIS